MPSGDKTEVVTRKSWQATRSLAADFLNLIADAYELPLSTFKVVIEAEVGSVVAVTIWTSETKKVAEQADALISAAELLRGD